MKIGILNTDAVKPEFAARFGEYPDMFARLLQAGEPGLELITYEVVSGEYPQDIDEVDGYLITGSKLSVYDDVPWIHELKAFVRKLHEAKKKTVGICFGHQLVAEALGGKTQAADQGWCVGVHSVKLNADATDYGLGCGEFRLLSNHKDQVQEMATGGRLLASTDTCQMAMTAVGDHILTVQGHPEFDKDYARALLDMRREILGESLYQDAVSSLTQEIDNMRVASWITNFVAGSAAEEELL
jgi:GMP synthase-like glutamine amidotransferase